MCRTHKNRGVKTRQLDDGIGYTLVLHLEELGNGRWPYQITLTDRGTAVAAINHDPHRGRLQTAIANSMTVRDLVAISQSASNASRC